MQHDGRTDLSFTVPRADLPRVEAVLQGIVSDIGAQRYSADDGIAKLSLVGAGMKSNPGVAADMFDALANEGINIEMISTSEIKISVLVELSKGEQALRAVHKAFLGV